MPAGGGKFELDERPTLIQRPLRNRKMQYAIMVGAAEAIRRKKNRESAELKSSQINRRSNQVSALTVHENPQIYDASQWSIHLTLVFTGLGPLSRLCYVLIGRQPSDHFLDFRSVR